jgi:feruloyl esterase
MIPKNSFSFALVVLMASASVVAFVPAARAACPGAALTAPANTTITGQTLVAATLTTPEYCDVTGYVTTNLVGGNKDMFELALPDPPAWNGKFLFMGNGGFDGAIQASVASGLTLGTGEYATAAFDGGHESILGPVLAAFDGSFGFNNPTAQSDYLWFGVHVAAQATEALTQQYYAKPPAHRYFEGCSEGGGQAVLESQNYPDDFDGIIGGDPAIGFALVGYHWNYNNELSSPHAYLPPTKIDNLLDPAITKECDEIDGVKDGLIQDPAKCHFNPATIQCPASEPESTADNDPSCLSAGQVRALKAIYSGAKTSDGTQVYPGFSVSNPAGPVGWSTWISGETPPTLGIPEPWGPFPAPPFFFSPLTGLFTAPLQWTFVDQFFRFFVFNDVNFDTRSFDLNDPAQLQAVEHPPANANCPACYNPDLDAFRENHGKLILYHGYSDQAVTPFETILYYNLIAQAQHGGLDRTREFARLFLEPGMHHCGGGPGPNLFDMLTPLDAWVTTGKRPDSITAFHFVNNDLTKPIDRTMPLCAYPEVAAYIGGDVNQAASWRCREPEEGDEGDEHGDGGDGGDEGGGGHGGGQGEAR